MKTVRRLMGLLLFAALLCICGAGCCETTLPSLEDGALWAGVVLAEEGRLALELRMQDGAIARYENLIPASVSPQAVRLEKKMDGDYVDLRFEEEGCDIPGYIRFNHRDGTWMFSMIWVQVGYGHFSMHPYEGQMLISRTESDHVLLIGGENFDLSEDALSYEGLAMQIAQLKRQSEEEDDARTLAVLAQAFPQEQFDGLRVIERSLRMNEEKPLLLAAVEREGQAVFYLVNHWAEQPQYARFGGDVLPMPEDVYINMPAPGYSDCKGSITCYYEKGQCGWSFAIDEHGEMTIISCVFEDDGEWWEAGFGETYMSVYPGHSLDRGSELLAYMPERARNPELFSLLEVKALMEQTYADYQNGEAPIIPPSDAAYAFPQPCGAELKKGTHAVYSGPGESYYREANGKAQVSANDWVQVFGREGDWALVQYRVDGKLMRFGYVHRSAVKDFGALPELVFEAEAVCQDNGFVTSNPLGEGGRIELTEEFTAMTRLCVLGDFWMYVEMELPNGKRARMFAEIVPSHG